MNLDMPLDEIINLSNHSSRGGGSDRRDGRGRDRGRGRGRRGGRGQKVRSFGDSASSFVDLPTPSAPPIRQSSGSTFGNGRALVSFLRPKRPAASDIAKVSEESVKKSVFFVDFYVFCIIYKVDPLLT